MDQFGTFRAVRSRPSDLQLSDGEPKFIGRVEQVGLFHCVQVKDAMWVIFLIGVLMYILAEYFSWRSVEWIVEM